MTLVRLTGTEVIRHSVEIDLPDEELAELKALWAAGEPVAVNEFVGGYFSLNTEDDGEFDDCEAYTVTVAPDGSRRCVLLEGA